MFFKKSSLILFLSLASIAVLALPVKAQEADEETLPYPIVTPSDSGAYHAINQLPESIRRSMPFAREFYEFARHAGTSGTIDYAAYLNTFEEARQDLLRSSERNLKTTTTQSLSGQWSNIGLVGANTVPSAGITTAIIFDPQNPVIMYAGGSGGVWKSTDTGSHWFQLTDDQLPNLSVATIAIDPVTPDTIYVGTGYGYGSVPNYGGAGLFESKDGGSTWERLTVAKDSGCFVKVLVDPANHNVILASSYDQTNVDPTPALYRSTDFGTTWTSVFSHGIVWDIIATQGSNPALYLMAGGDENGVNAGANAGVWKSTDDGKTWAKISTSNFPKSIGRSALASPTKAPNKIFALMTDPGGSSSYLYKSTDIGVTWASDTIPAPVPSGLFVIPNDNHSQGWYDLYLAITPNSVTSDTIYAGGVVAWVLRGAAGWQEFSDYDPAHQNGAEGFPHVDHHSFAINPLNSNIVYDGDDGGLWINYAAGSNAGSGWQLHSLNMVSSRFYHFAIDRNNLNVTWAGAQDQGLWKITNGQAPIHEADVPGELGLGDAMQPLISVQNSAHIYAEGPDGEILQFSNNSWQLTADTAELVTDPCGWDNPFAMSPVSHVNTASSSILYVGRQHLWQSINGGSAWTKLSPSFGGTPDGVSYCSAIGLPGWDTAKFIYAAGGGSSFQLSTDFGVSWHARTSPGYVTSIGATSQDPKFVVVSLSLNNKKVMMSEDSGETWTERSGMPGASLPGADTNKSCNVMSIAIDSTSPLTTWYAATDFGMYSTTDAGLHWTSMQLGLFPCRDVRIAPNGTTLRVATYGRGLWEYSGGTGGVELTSLSATKSSNGTALAWYVDGEPAGASFSVERSIDGESYQSIKSIGGLGASPTRHDYSYADPTTAPGTYLYRIHEVDLDGSARYSNSVELHYGTDQIYVYQPYPNPFIPNGTGNVTLSYELPARDNVQLRIYNMTGVLVRTLQNGPLDGGPQIALWDGRNSEGNLVGAGAYIFSIQTGQSGSLQNKIMVVRE